MIKVHSTDREYGSVIDAFLAQPLSANLSRPSDVVDALTTVFVGTSRTRYGPMPPPERLVAIRQVLRESVEQGIPVRVLTPWGSKKPKAGHGIDVAELSAVYQVLALAEAVRKVHAPGIDWMLPLEDVSGYYLWEDGSAGDTMRADSERYVKQMRLLRQAVAPDARFVAESEHVGFDAFRAKCEEIRPALREFLLTSSAATRAELLQHLRAEFGWAGNLPQEQVDYYMLSYSRQYPAASGLENTDRLARYLAQSWARHQMKLRAPGWHTPYVQVSFPTPVPGIPETLESRRLYYRSMPSDHTRNHMPPWRAKGFLCVSDSGVQFKMASWREVDGHRLVENNVVVEGNGASVDVEADYMVK